MTFSRRQMLMGAGGLAALALGTRVPALTPGPDVYELRSRETSFVFDGQETRGLVSLADKAPPPVLRLRQGVPAELAYTNGLEDYSTLHWHGIRLPNAMDGVPYLTQFPVAQGETFRYAFTPPDAGTYWYHPHCRTMDQMARGLTGMLIVQERDDPGFDADIPLNLKDFRADGAGGLLPHFTPRGAARGGTLGHLKTTNWQSAPRMEVPAGALVRLRILVSDTTRVHRLVFPDVPGRIVAWDGHPVNEAVPWPTSEAPLWLAPGQRVDVVLLTPAEGNTPLVVESLIGKRSRFAVATLRPRGASLGRTVDEITPLPRNPIGIADPARAEVREIEFGWSPEGDGVDNGLCGTFDYVFWSINRAPWPGDAVQGIGPVLRLKRGGHYVLRLRNSSPNLHPIHLHGLVFRPIRSNLRPLPANDTDTILLLKDEVVDVALVADNPGHWAFHCHVIEHQKSGLSGYISVE